MNKFVKPLAVLFAPVLTYLWLFHALPYLVETTTDPDPVLKKKALAEYVLEILDIANQYCDLEAHGLRGYEVVLDDTPLRSHGVTSEVGLADRGFGKNIIRITVSRSDWPLMYDRYRYHVVVHEISHAFFRIQHSNDEGNYMYPIVTFISREKMRRQFISNLKEVCQEGKLDSSLKAANSEKYHPRFATKSRVANFQWTR